MERSIKVVRHKPHNYAQQLPRDDFLIFRVSEEVFLKNDNMLSMLVAMFEEKEKKSVRNDRHHVNLHE